MSPSETSISSASSDDVLSDDDDEWREDNGRQNDASLSDSGSQSVALSCSVLVFIFSFLPFLKKNYALESVCETTSSKKF